ncbi:Short chain dehydrogenase asqE [Fulvia fulva]|uniref:Short chain dehydrogenase asqE n=1 Tax=Passalora fulva TaxID=5499 RepID=A0A9Q8UTP4_PASFU|nr:Short chain dehydrogenase asqE [Fulvia fulva]UJO22030.1 Short chain dehydrogenase asqE [Fulvia fulva]
MSTARPLEGKVAIVTGGSRGIGREIALQFARKGCKAITITYLNNIEAAKSCVTEIRRLGCEAIAIQGVDVQGHQALYQELADSMIQQTLSAFSTTGIDILVNNAGAAALYPNDAQAALEFYGIFNLNVLTPYMLIQAVLPVIRPGGSIINITSISARVVLGGPTIIYSASKAALEHMTRNFAVTYGAKKQITINNVSPGATDTDGLRQASQEIIDIVKNEWTIEKRLGRPSEVADVVCWLCGGGGARWINGDTINASGGANKQLHLDSTTSSIRHHQNQLTTARMVFEFTGNPPAFGRPPTFASFTATPATNKLPRSPFATASFGSSFGGAASLPLNSSTVTPLGITTTHTQASRDDIPPEVEIAQDDDLMRALKRCATNRQAVFGRHDMDADAALNEVLEMCDLDAGRLMEALREANSEIGMFARAVFSTLLQRHSELQPADSATEKFEKIEKIEKIEETVPRWLSGEDRKKSKIPLLVAKKAKQENDEVIISEGPVEELVHATTTPGNAATSSPTKPFRFLDLPAEMRNIVYRKLLVSKTGYIFLAGRPFLDGDTVRQIEANRDLRKGLASDCKPVILGTCNQIYEETKDILYAENKIIMSFKVEKSTKPFLPTQRIDLPSLAQIKSLVLVLDLCSSSSNSSLSHRFLSVQDFVALVCWRELQAMTGLEQLRITCVERGGIDHRQAMLVQVMERIPRACQVTFGAETEFEKEYVKKVIEDADEPHYKSYYNLATSYEADVDMVRKCGEAAMATKGCKNGDERDYRFTDRSFSNLGSLAGSQAIDPRYVLGGGS